MAEIPGFPAPNQTECPLCGTSYEHVARPVLVFGLDIPSGIFTNRCPACCAIAIWHWDKLMHLHPKGDVPGRDFSPGE